MGQFFSKVNPMHFILRYNTYFTLLHFNHANEYTVQAAKSFLCLQVTTCIFHINVQSAYEILKKY